jgi:DNA-binding transcriptional LysR family regulator
MKKIHGGLSRIACPSLAELNALLVVAELKSFTKAAQALNLTQSAVSRQISSLEQFLGVSLFIRAKGRLLVTDQAAHYISKIESPLDQLERASNDLKLLKTVGSELRLSTLPTFAAKWLIPKLPTFFQSSPEVTLSFVSHTKAYVTDDPNAPDAAIRFGSGNWLNEQAFYLEGHQVCAIMSASKKPVTTLEGLNNATSPHVGTHRLAGVANDQKTKGCKLEKRNAIRSVFPLGTGCKFGVRYRVGAQMFSTRRHQRWESSGNFS